MSSTPEARSASSAQESRGTSSLPAPRTAEWQIAIAGLMIGAGGVLLGLQLDANGGLSGTGLVPLGIGALLALVGGLVQVGTHAGRIPRDGIGTFAALTSFLGLAFAVSGVLAPGGPWMFLEVLVLLGIVARRAREGSAPRWIGGGSLLVLGLMLLFRLWISYQGSEHRWQLLSIRIPVLSWIPLAFLEPIQSVSLGSFTPRELGFPPAGLEFATSMTLWAIGFALCAGGLALAQSAAREHENDRIHDLIHTLPPPLGGLVERLIPEEEWQALGLHGMSERRLARRIEALATERFQRQREIQAAFQSTALLPMTNPGGFAGGIYQALTGAPRPVDVESDENRDVEGDAGRKEGT